MRTWIERRNLLYYCYICVLIFYCDVGKVLINKIKLGASNTFLRELAIEDPDSYRNHLRMEKSKFEELLFLVAPLIKKENTLMRDSIPNRIKFQIVLRYPPTGDSFGSFDFLYRVLIIQYPTYFKKLFAKKAIYFVLSI